MTLFTALLLASALGALGAHPAHRLVGTAAVPRLHPALASAVLFIGALLVIAAHRLSVVLAGCIAAVTLVRVAQVRRHARGARQRRAIVADFLGHVVSNLEAGSTVAESCRRAAARLPQSCPAGLARGISQLVAASQASAAPRELSGSDSTRELADVAALWTLSVDRGLPMADLLTRARERIDAAQRHTAATDAALAGPKTTATVLTLLPLAGVAMGSAMGANPLGLLFGGGAGGWLLVLGTALVCAGYLACQEIIARAAA